jgi:hypothetical protein
MMAGSGSISLTNVFGCGSGRPKNIWIPRIRIRNTAYLLKYLVGCFAFSQRKPFAEKKIRGKKVIGYPQP